MDREAKSPRGRMLCGAKDGVLNNELCCGCGACVGVCPSGALSIDIFTSHAPVKDESRCIGCGLCFAVCPGRGYPVVSWSAPHADAGIRVLPERGPVWRYLKGHATDPAIRLNSASGGIATAVLLHLLETGQVDEVAVVGMEKERPVARLTDDPRVVRDAMMSKYGPVPMLATLIPELRKHPRRIAMTVTPCQLGGWRRAAERIAGLRESDILSVGLFCGQVQSYHALAGIAATLGLSYPGEAKFVAWRHGPYPGNVRFERPDGAVFEKPLYRWLDVAVPYFSLPRCFLCPDGGNWLADVTLGDIHSGGSDQTVIVCRTRRGEAMLESARAAGAIVMAELTPAQAESCVIRGITRSKMLPALALNSWLKKKLQPAPEFDYDAESLLQGSIRWLIPLWILKYRITFWARSGWRWRLLLKHPAEMEKTGNFLYYFPATIPGFMTAIEVGKFVMRLINRG